LEDNQVNVSDEEEEVAVNKFSYNSCEVFKVKLPENKAILDGSRTL
jgi:hypothetical protein